MEPLWGVLVIITTLIAWLGQLASAISPATPAQLGMDPGTEMADRCVSADMRGEAVWGSITLWTLPLAGLLLVADSPWWPHMALIGGALLLYFSGHGITVRLVMHARHIPIGPPTSITSHYISLSLWALIALITMVMALVNLSHFS